MSHGKLRNEKTCLNCGSDVEERFCPHCGQENIEPKQPFHYLFTHFIEDFTHYDGQFWKTIKYLLFFPGKLTNEYLDGKRQSYVSPVKLYIFISFITFFFFSFSLNNDVEKSHKHPLPKENAQRIDVAKDQIKNLEENKVISKELTEKIEEKVSTEEVETETSDISIDLHSKILGTNTIEQYDSVAAIKKGAYKLFRPYAAKFFEIKDKNLSNAEITESFYESLIHNLPKALFFYLPFFAFILWLFHNKKKWFYFEHGTFTLHYFSFLLLVILILNYIPDVNGFWGYVFGIINFAIVVYSMLYFFIAHRNVYEYRIKSTILKGIGIFIINTFLLLIFAIGLVMVSILFIH